MSEVPGAPAPDAVAPSEVPPLVVVIMAGGAGTRFWPASTRLRPKQFLRLLGDRTLLQQSYDRARLLTDPGRILVLTNADFTGLVREQLPDVPAENVVGEPMRRDTAAAVALGALLTRARFGDAVMVVLTADHLIDPPDAFRRGVLSAARAAHSEGALYTFGVPPTYAATGYGYLHQGAEVLDDDGIKHYELRGFREKPDLETARGYLESGEFWWNSGMFVWSTDAILAAFDRFLPGHRFALGPAVGTVGTAEEGAALTRAFVELPSISIDLGVMERAERVRMVASTFSWSDLGGWLAVEEFYHPDDRGNRARGSIVLLDADDNMVVTEDPEELIALVGVSNLIVVRSGPRTLVVDRSRAEEVKELVRRLEDAGHGEHA